MSKWTHHLEDRGLLDPGPRVDSMIANNHPDNGHPRPVNVADELEQAIRQAQDWQELEMVLERAQAAYQAGDLDADQVERLAQIAQQEAQTLPENADDLRLSELFKEQPVRRVYSKILNEVVVFAADGVEISPDNDLVVYRQTELRQLPGRSPTPMRAIHAAKKVFDGELIDATEARTYEPATPRP